MKSYRIAWPITSDRVCLAFTHRSTIHASVDRPLAVAKDFLARGSARTVCGVDAPIVPIGYRNAPDVVGAAPWPPPVHGIAADRCPDCADRLGLNGRQRHGGSFWLSLTRTEVAA